MSISSEITRINGNIASAYTAVSGKGGTLPTARNSANLPAAIESIPGGKPEQSKTLTLGAAAPSTVTPDSGKVLSSVPVVLDTSVIKAANIAKGVTMLGIQGAHEGGGGGGGKFDRNSFHTVTIKNESSNDVRCSGNTEQNQNIDYAISSNIVSGTGTLMLPFPTNFIKLSSPNYRIINIIASDASKVFFVRDAGIYIGIIEGDVTITSVVSCFLPDTLVTLADGTKKQIKDITYSDRLKVWNFDTGEYDTAPICWLTRSGLKNGHYYKLAFSDGTVLKTTGHNSNHKVYNVDERFFKGVDKTEIGDRIFSENGIVTVTNKEYIEEEIEYYNLITTGTINCFAEGILTSDRYGNLYPIDENMVYVKEGREIRPYSEFEAVGIKRYWYDTLRLGEVTGTAEETKLYIDKLECQMLPLPEDDT